MIKLKGTIFAKKFELKCENNYVCMVFQSKLQNLIDIISKEGCPKNCEYVVRKPEDNPTFIYGVLTSKEAQ